MPPNHMKCQETIQVPMTQRSLGAGFDQDREPLEGLQFSKKLMVLMTSSREDQLSLHQSNCSVRNSGGSVLLGLPSQVGAKL